MRNLILVSICLLLAVVAAALLATGALLAGAGVVVRQCAYNVLMDAREGGG